jgi:hypothetical protein
MLEIYMNRVQDLLVAPKNRPKEGLEIQNNAAKGLRMVKVNTVMEVMNLLAVGQSQQTLAATGLNAKSSRAHTIFELRLVKIITNPAALRRKDRTVTQSASMRLVDLAGSEKVTKVREGLAKGIISAKELEQRELEGRAINNSLMALGMVISKVAKACAKEDLREREAEIKKIVWRGSKLTHLLRESISGNSRTVMVAAVSPSSSEFAETKSTLRFATRLKKVKLNARKGSLSGSKEAIALIEARKRIAQLEKQLAESGGGNSSMDQEELTRIKREQEAALERVKQDMAAQNVAEKAEIERDRQILHQMEVDAKKDADQAKRQMQEIMELQKKKDAVKRAPHLLTILEDASLIGLFREPLMEGDTHVGCDPGANVVLDGYRIEAEHCVFTRSGDAITMRVCEPGLAVRVNGKPIKSTDPVVLSHNDRLIIGQDFFYRLIVSSFMESQPRSQAAEDQVYYSYHFMQREANADLLEGFAISRQEKDAEKAELKRKLEMKDLLLDRMQKEQEQAQAQREIAEQVKLEEMKKSMEVELNKGMLEKQELAAKLEQENLKMERRVKRMRLDMQERISEEREKASQFKLQEEHKRKKQEQDWARLQLELAPVLPGVQQANEFAKSVGINSSYEVTLAAHKTYDSDEPVVYVKATNLDTGDTQLLDIDTFAHKLSQMRRIENYTRHDMPREEALAKFDPQPFIIRHNHIDHMGTVTIPLRNCSTFRGISGTPQIVSMTREVLGKLKMEVSPVVPPVLHTTDAATVEELYAMDKLDYLDIHVHVEHCITIVSPWGKALRIDLTMPRFVESSAVMGAFTTEYKDHDDNGQLLGEMGATHQSPVFQNPSFEGGERDFKNLDLTVTLRIHNLQLEKCRNWLSHGKMLLQVYGSRASSAAPTETTDMLSPHAMRTKIMLASVRTRNQNNREKGLPLSYFSARESTDDVTENVDVSPPASLMEEAKERGGRVVSSAVGPADDLASLKTQLRLQKEENAKLQKDLEEHERNKCCSLQ